MDADEEKLLHKILEKKSTDESGGEGKESSKDHSKKKHKEKKLKKKGSEESSTSSSSDNEKRSKKEHKEIKPKMKESEKTSTSSSSDDEKRPKKKGNGHKLGHTFMRGIQENLLYRRKKGTKRKKIHFQRRQCRK